MTIDSDTFVRFSALARRLPMFINQKSINPQNQSVLLGRMGDHHTYFVNSVPDGNPDPRPEDTYFVGPWFSYPRGIGYMLRCVTGVTNHSPTANTAKSPFLVDTLLSLEPPLPHHIHYPSDDVMIGSWIAALKLFPDTSVRFETVPEPVHKVVPTPFLPDPLDTIIIDDKEGWHDYARRRKGYDGPPSWSSVCVHHISARQRRKFRQVGEMQGEWKDGRGQE